MVEHEIILAHVSQKDRGWLLSHPEFKLSTPEQSEYDKMIKRFDAGEPLPYILGYKEFYGRTFTVNKHTLIPRPESEMIIDLTKIIAAHIHTPTIIDIGTGSGCLAITAALEIPHAQVYASDISNDALAIAKQNAQSLHATVTYKQGNLLESINIAGENNIILANLPYIPTDELKELDDRVKNHEPHIALDGGKDGLDYYRKLVTQLPHSSWHVLCEITPSQKDSLPLIIKKTHPQARITIHNDLAGLPRIVHAINPTP